MFISSVDVELPAAPSRSVRVHDACKRSVNAPTGFSRAYTCGRNMHHSTAAPTLASTPCVTVKFDATAFHLLHNSDGGNSTYRVQSGLHRRWWVFSLAWPCPQGTGSRRTTAFLGSGAQLARKRSASEPLQIIIRRPCSNLETSTIMFFYKHVTCGALLGVGSTSCTLHACLR